MQVFKHLRLHRSTQRRQLSNIPCSAMPDFFQTLSGELRESLEDSPILRHCLVHIVLSLLTKRRLRIWELDAPGELQLNLCPALCIWFSYLCFAELHFFDQNHEGLAQLGLGRTHEPGSHCWVLDTQLPDGETERQRCLTQKESQYRSSWQELIWCSDFQDLSFPIFLCPNSSYFTSHAILQSFNSRGWVPAYCVKCSFLGKDTDTDPLTATQQYPLSHDNSAHTQTPTLQWIAFNMRKESQASFAAGKAQDIISCTMTEDVQ